MLVSGCYRNSSCQLSYLRVLPCSLGINHFHADSGNFFSSTELQHKTNLSHKAAGHEHSIACPSGDIFVPDTSILHLYVLHLTLSLNRVAPLYFSLRSQATFDTFNVPTTKKQTWAKTKKKATASS